MYAERGILERYIIKRPTIYVDIVFGCDVIGVREKFERVLFFYLI